jgi:hypothetical protein
MSAALYPLVGAAISWLGLICAGMIVNDLAVYRDKIVAALLMEPR